MVSADRNVLGNVRVSNSFDNCDGNFEPSTRLSRNQSALAKLRKGTPPVAERFELFFQGIELANGYHELLDADELLRRNNAVNQERTLDGKYELPTESWLLSAMRSGIRPCVGVAVGFDRLVMLGSGATSIREVLTFPIDIA